MHPENNKIFNIAESEGAKARYNGDSIKTNPYKYGTTLYKAFNKGWHEEDMYSNPMTIIENG